MTDERRAEVIAGLRQIADFLEQHPGVPAPDYSTLNSRAGTKEQIAAIARLATWRKDYGDNYFSLHKEFPGDLALDVYTERSTVCRKVVTGRRMLPAEPEREVEVYEWICDEPLLEAK